VSETEGEREKAMEGRVCVCVCEVTSIIVLSDHLLYYILIGVYKRH